MSHFQTAEAFFHACESLKDWAGCKEFTEDGASFVGQCEPLTGITTVEGYCDWMAGLGLGPLAGCSYTLNSAAYDENTNTALFFGTFHGTHTSEGGPVDPTNMTTASHYVYAIVMSSSGKVASMTKIWNAPWALAELGWA